MIDYLKGKIIDKQPPVLILENGDIGYTVEASMQTFYQLPEKTHEIFVYIHLIIKEEKPVLYGFLTIEERKLFQELIKVNTIGPKAGLAILSSLDHHSLYQVVLNEDIATLQKTPGIGRKTAERLLLELSNRLEFWRPSSRNSEDEKGTASETRLYTTQKDAISALVSLGYKPQTATQVIRHLAQQNLSTEQLIRTALNHLTHP